MSEVWAGCPKLGYASLIISTYSLKVYIQFISAYAIWCGSSCLYFILSNIFQIVKTIAKLHLIRGGGRPKKMGGGPCDFRRTEPCIVHIGTRLDPNGPKQTLQDQIGP